MEEFTMVQSMLKILNSNNAKKRAVIETLPIVLDTYDIHGKFEVYDLILISTQNLCFQLFDPQFINSAWKDSDVSLDNLKSLLFYFIDIIKNHRSTDIIQLFEHCLELSVKIDFKNCSNEKIIYIGFFMEKIYISFRGELDDCTYLNILRKILIYVLNEPYLKKKKLDAILMLLNNIVSINYIPTLWQNIKPMLKNYPNRLIHLIFNMQCLFFDSSCVDIILNDSDFWNLSCNLLNCENNVIRTYNNVVLKLSCSQLSNENVNFCSNYKTEQFLKVWNDYVIVMETLENTQQHLTLPILSTAKKLALNDADDYKLPLKWITAMYCKMAKHSSRYVVLASIDIITNMPTISLKMNEQLLRSFVDSLNNVFLYKMSSELSINQPQLEIILSAWFDKLIMSNDGHDIFGIFLSYIPTVKWSIVPLIFLIKSLANISLNCSIGFNIFDHILKIKSTVEKMPNSYLKSVVLLFLFVFSNKFLADIKTEFSCDLFDCVMVYHKNTKSWKYMIDSICQINDLDRLDKNLSQLVKQKHKMYSTSIGLFVLSNICVNNLVCIQEVNEIFSNTIEILDLLHFLECLLDVEHHYGQRDTGISEVLDKNIWPLTALWVEKCLENKEEDSCDDPIVCRFLDRILSSNRIVNNKNIINCWLNRCGTMMKNISNYSLLAIFSWIGKYAMRNSNEHELKINWLNFTKYFINSGFFSLKNREFYHSKKPGMHKSPLVEIVDTFFQYSSVPYEQMSDIFDWLMEKTVERHDNYWSIYFSTAKTFLHKFPIQVYSEKIIQFIEICWEFLISCRVSCFSNTIKCFIEMAFQNSLLAEEKYVKFITNKVIQNLLTETCRDKFSVCFSIFLLQFFEKQQPNIINILESHQIMSKFFAKCMLFSIDRYGALKIEWDTLEYVRSLNDFPLIGDISIECLPDDKYLRFNVIKCLYKLNSDLFLKNVLQNVIKSESLSRDRKFFHNSKAYYIKQRVVQILLFIACDKQYEPFIFEENIYKWALSSLKEVSHIHSVAYQLIWLLVLIYNKNYSFSDFWNDFKNAQENHNYLCSFICIIYQLHKLKTNKEFETNAIRHLLPLCFSNGYKTRFYAQATMCRLFSSNHEESPWPFLCETMENIIANIEHTKNYENPFHDFFYKELDLINSLTVKNVCVEVPRLLNIVYEERFPIKWLNDIFVSMNINDKYDLSHCSVSSFIEKNTGSLLSNEIIVLDNALNAQRKYIPSQPLDKNTNNSMLIVVASLIDKVTNLGGLARTCQVFGASSLAIDNLSYVKNREFTALSMTAEKHQNIIEVRVKNLKSYLQKKKLEGYQIVAAEQTVDSVKLHDFMLPLKCVLLLGNETSGIPHDLLSIMDTCVEIEQFGIIRSLNVHVAGSVFIWEYTKQHCLNVSHK